MTALPFRVGVFQFAPTFGDVEGNLARLEAALMGSPPADLVVLPELFATGYQFVSREEALSLAEPVPEGRTTKTLLRLARARNAVLVAGLAERDGGRLYNAAVAVGPSGVLARYRKIHLFAEEKEWFEPGDLDFPVFAAGPARVGLMVCYDWRFPEAARTLALLGADVLAHPANLVHRHGPDAMLTRALENRVFAATADRAGSEARGGKAELRFAGASQVVSPHGEILFRMESGEEVFRAVETDLTLARDKHVTPRNDILADRRPRFYKL